MTNGTSQGLFVVVAIVIFGIFVLISYVLFKDTLQPALANIFKDSLTQAEENLTGIVKENSSNVQSSREDEKYLYAKIRDADEVKGETEIWVQAKKLKNGTLELDKSSISDGNYTSGYTDMTGSLAIPDTINGMKIVKIGRSAFHNSKFDGKLILPDSLTSIDFQAFYNSTFDGELKLPNSLTSIDSQAFYNSTFDGELKLPDGLTSIGSIAFHNSTFDGELKLPDSLTSIGSQAFYTSEFDGELKLPNSLTIIDSYAFYKSTFDGELKLPDSLTKIGFSAFYNSTFDGKLILPDSLTSIGSHAFYKSNFDGELKLPDSLTSIGFNTFYNSTFTGTLDVSHVKYIQGGAFDKSKIDKVIRGDVGMSDGTRYNNTSGIHPKAIKLANGSWYDGSND